MKKIVGVATNWTARLLGPVVPPHAPSMYGKCPKREIDTEKQTCSTFLKKFDRRISRHCRWIRPFPFGISLRKKSCPCVNATASAPKSFKSVTPNKSIEMRWNPLLFLNMNHGGFGQSQKDIRCMYTESLLSIAPFLPWTWCRLIPEWLGG